jgi:hypothetical protein
VTKISTVAILDVVPVDYLMNVFLCLIDGDWRKVPVDDQRRRSFKMATTATILDLVPVNYLMNARVVIPRVFIYEVEVQLAFISYNLYLSVKNAYVRPS